MNPDTTHRNCKNAEMTLPSDTGLPEEVAAAPCLDGSFSVHPAAHCLHKLYSLSFSPVWFSFCATLSSPSGLKCSTAFYSRKLAAIKESDT